MAKSLILELHPDTESMYLDVLVKAIQDVSALVADVDYAVTRERQGRKWVVTSLRSSIPTMTIEPAINGTGTVDAVATGLQLITAEAEPEAPPPYFSEEALDDLRRMRRLFRYKKARLSKLVVKTEDSDIAVATIRDDIGRKVDRVLRGSYTVLGSLEGTLEAMSLRGKSPAFTIWERVTGRPVRCFFDKERWYDTIVSLMRQKTRVLVVGKVTYFRNGMPRFIANVREIGNMTPDESLPKGDFGSIPDLTGGEDAVDYINSMRK